MPDLPFWAYGLIVLVGGVIWLNLSSRRDRARFEKLDGACSKCGGPTDQQRNPGATMCADCIEKAGDRHQKNVYLIGTVFFGGLGLFILDANAGLRVVLLVIAGVNFVWYDKWKNK